MSMLFFLFSLPGEAVLKVNSCVGFFFVGEKGKWCTYLHICVYPYFLFWASYAKLEIPEYSLETVYSTNGGTKWKAKQEDTVTY